MSDAQKPTSVPLTRICIQGCDDSTEIPLDEFNSFELEVIRKFARVSWKHSQYGCQPVVAFQTGEEKLNVPRTGTYVDWQYDEEYERGL